MYLPPSARSIYPLQSATNSGGAAAAAAVVPPVVPPVKEIDPFDLNANNVFEAPKPAAAAVAQPAVSTVNPPVNVSAQFDAHIKTLNFSPEIPADAAQKIQQGDLSFIKDMVNVAGQQAYKQAILDSSKILNAQREDIIGTAVDKAGKNMNTKSAIDTLLDVFPSAKNPNIRPIAEAYMASYLKKGQDPHTAALSTKKIMARSAEFMAEDLEIDVAPRSMRGQRGGLMADADDAQEIDWLSVARQAG